MENFAKMHHHNEGFLGIIVSIFLTIWHFFTLNNMVAYGAIFASLSTGIFYIVQVIKLLRKKK